MPRYTVTVPFKEKAADAPEKDEAIDFSITAESSVEAAQEAIKRVQALGENPYASWNVVVDEGGVNVKEMSGGQMFRLTDVDSDEDPAFGQQSLLSMEEFMGQFEASPEELLTLYKRAVDLSQSAADEKEACRSVLALVMDASHTEAGSILLKDDQKNDLYFVTATGPKADEITDFRVPIGMGFAGYTAESGETLAISDVAKDPRFYKDVSEALGFETRSLLATPIRFRNRILGVLELVNELRDDCFTAYDLEIARHMASYLALMLIAIRNASR